MSDTTDQTAVQPIALSDGPLDFQPAVMRTYANSSDFMDPNSFEFARLVEVLS
jgi:hypothetical protein